MPSILHQLPRFDDGERHQQQHHDLEDGMSAGSSTASTTTSTTASNNNNNSNNNIRSRLKGRHSPTQSEDGGDRLPLLQRQDDSSSDSEDSGTTGEAGNGNHHHHHHHHTVTTPASIYRYMRLVGLAGLLTCCLYYSPAFFLESVYFPAHGRMFPGGLRSLTSTPDLHYESPEASSLAAVQEDTAHIPRIVHVTYKSREELPPEWEYSIQQWQEKHPDWEVRFWSDDDIAEFVHQEFPEMESLWKSYKYFIQRVDSVRYMILYHFGGIYSDMDIYPATNLDGLLRQWEDAGKSVLLAESFNMGVTNAFMASAPHSAFFGCVINQLPHYQYKLHHLIGWQHWEVLSSAGSNFLWGMVGHCRQEDHEVEVMAARSFRGCSVCDAWETGQPAETCDTEWLHHSSTNSSWHQHASWFHALLFNVSYSFLCKPFRACFICVTILLIVVHKRRNANSHSDGRRAIAKS